MKAWSSSGSVRSAVSKIADDDVLVHLVRFEHERARRLGDPLESEAILERSPRVCEAGAAQCRLEPLDELRVRPDVGSVIDHDEAARRVGRRVEGGQPTRHRVSDHDRAVDRQRTEKLMELSCELFERGGRSVALTMGGQVDRDAPC